MELQHPYVLRTLQPPDFHKGYLQLLAQLTKVGNISEEEFTNRLKHMQNCGDHHRIAVIEDVDRKLLVGSGTLFIELKLVRNCGKVGHIEDIVVDQSTRGQHLGQRVVEYLTDVAKEQGCYKVALSTGLCIHSIWTGISNIMYLGDLKFGDPESSIPSHRQCAFGSTASLTLQL